ncbi:MAG: hypothetical protein ACP5VP_11280 [Candidatus Limnocylindrales bacterium]
MSQPRAQAVVGRKGIPLDAQAPIYGALLTRLSELQRRGYEAEVGRLRERLRAAVREQPLDEVRAEMAAARRAADALERRA